MHHLSIDLETYSSVPLQKAGAHKYIESPDFQILLCAYSVDGSPVRCIDVAAAKADSGYNDELSEWYGLLQAVADPRIIFHAYNAAFEWGCLSKELGCQLDPSQWRCSMLHALYCGYPAGLDAAGKAMGLPEAKQKMQVGKSLIRYFCVPCEATAANGRRTRNLPKHHPERWELFKQYNTGDVITEMEIERRLQNFLVPDEVQKQWESDLLINARGISVDTELVRGALEIGGKARGELMSEAAYISGLDNPNSIDQLSKWLEKELDEELPDLRKDTVTRLLGRDAGSDAARRMLEIRQELGKTSVKKYDAMSAVVGADDRARGLLKFYKANRTGRWGGALVQPQNLPRTHIDYDLLPLARDTVKRQDGAKLRTLYGSVPDTLSQLIRTSFVASPGNVLLDADFSSIEARVISWLAGEQWRLDVFRTHGKIYEASASQMFGVPLELIKKGNPEYALRQRGKVAELALGYQGGVGAMRTMDAGHQLDDLSDGEVKEIVDRWRDANKRIKELWYRVDAAAVSVVQNCTAVGVNGLVFAREIDPGNTLDFMTILLPSGRKLYYANPRMGVNRWDRPSVTYSGLDQTSKKWKPIETYGGKLVENIVQAIARDCLAVAIERLEVAGYAVVFHVHDEVVIDCPPERADLAAVSAIMSAPMPWAPDLPLAADGWIGEFYRKD